jgi:dihydroorotate dehydrogenase
LISYETLKKILFRFEPETAHNIAEYGLRVLGKCKIAKAYMEKKNYISNPKLTQEVFGVRFENPVGLAAGFDKNATMIKAMKSLGFGFTENWNYDSKTSRWKPKT